MQTRSPHGKQSLGDTLLMELLCQLVHRLTETYTTAMIQPKMVSINDIAQKGNTKSCVVSLSGGNVTGCALLAALGRLFTHSPLHCRVYFFLFLFAGKSLEGKAQTKEVVADAGRVVAPIRHTTVPGIVDPTATTVHAERAR